MFESIPLRSLSRGPSIALDYWERREALCALLPRHFLDPRAFAEQASLLSARRYDRTGLCAVLREQNRALGAGERTMENVARLADPRCLAVVGGQQAGLFGGPLYTLHKALTIVSLAGQLSGSLGQPVVPVFWIASEDSDLAEIDHASLTDAAGALVEVSLPRTAGEKLPVSLVRLGPGLSRALAAAAAALPAGDAARETEAALRRAYTPEATYPSAFGAWMHHVLADLGVITVDPSDGRLKRMAAPLFAREIAERGPVGRAVLRQTARLTAIGYKPQIELRDGFLTLFHQDPARDSIAVDGQGFRLKEANRTLSAAELGSLVEGGLERLTPNAVLRPLFQDTLLPTAAAVLGPAELAYWAQLPEAYAEAGIPMPVLFPRASLTLVDPAAGKLLDRFGLTVAEVATRGERILDELARRELPPDLLARLLEARARAAETWSRIADEVGTFERTLRPTAENASRTVQNRFAFMEKKMIKAARRKDGVLRARVTRLTASLAPGGGLQERSLCALPFLARYGTALPGLLLPELSLFTPEHRAVRLPA
jgi:bacillithiol synthase